MAAGPLIVLVGQTAAGKSDMALELAQRYSGEIICADSRTVYRGMDIGTAKPTAFYRQRIRHHMLDILDPDEEFSAGDMKRLCNQSIDEISKRDNIPFLVGGTGLYVSTVIYDFELGPKNKELRARLENLSLPELQERAERLGIKQTDINFLNKRHLTRAIERGGVSKTDNILRENCLFLGLDVGSDELKARIKSRIEGMFDRGLEDEVRSLEKKYGFDAPGMNAICYKEWKDYFYGEQTIDKLKQKLYTDTWQYAKRQKTWFKRDHNINWITSVEDASRVVQQFLIQ